MEIIHATGTSPGIAIGRAVIVEKRVASIYRVPIRQEEVESETTRFTEALTNLFQLFYGGEN